MLCNDTLYSKYVNFTPVHVIVVYFNIVWNDKLRFLMNYRTKFRIPFKHNVKIVLKQFYLHLNVFSYKISIDYNKVIEYFSEWKYNVLWKISK